ncbi:MAG: SIS domain-containing protein [Kiritimatiellae bacterium]|nr:SIS domain-containing protein [Kiritimatiellia bacterium]MDD5521036.1 SIS domain-containing protein [Kiritimatiellia bacterium]
MKKYKVDKVRIRKNIENSIIAITALSSRVGEIAAISSGIIAALKAGNKILVAGNGGSAAEALHFAEELTGRFKSNRVPLPAIALPADCTALTCIGNDFGFEAIFSRQVEALGRAGDVLVLFSTSGNSVNLIRALKVAERRKLRTVCFLGGNGGVMAGKGDWEIIVKHAETARIQEAHQVILHLILDAIEQAYI